MKKLLEKKKPNKPNYSYNLLEGIISLILWQVSLYIIGVDLGPVATIILFVITYLITLNLIRKFKSS